MLFNIATLCSISFIFFIQILRPMLGPDAVCPFTIGCTEYALLQLKQLPFHKAIIMICKRLLLCNPISNYLKNSAHHL
ncbi:membrane protein insertion efficiency factor YidD [Candidatus Dependentiae bacterium]|nr:membrane protein insertion efficiency factor YidD [Candidatus Dependentiae bacterium]